MKTDIISAALRRFGGAGVAVEAVDVRWTGATNLEGAAACEAVGTTRDGAVWSLAFVRSGLRWSCSGAPKCEIQSPAGEAIKTRVALLVEALEAGTAAPTDLKGGELWVSPEPAVTLQKGYAVQPAQAEQLAQIADLVKELEKGYYEAAPTELKQGCGYDIPVSPEPPPAESIPEVIPEAQPSEIPAVTPPAESIPELIPQPPRKKKFK